MKTVYEIIDQANEEVDSFVLNNIASIKEAYEATKHNEDSNIWEYLQDSIDEACSNYANDCVIYTQDQWEIVYAFKFSFNNHDSYYYDACDNVCDPTNHDEEIGWIAYFIIEALFREALTEKLYKYEQQKLMQIA